MATVKVKIMKGFSRQPFRKSFLIRYVYHFDKRPWFEKGFVSMHATNDVFIQYGTKTMTQIKCF